MDYSITRDELFGAKPSLVEMIITRFSKKKYLESKIDGLSADYAMALDQCQMMKQHIQNLESKIDHMHATIDLRPDAVEPEMPYSTAIVLAKRGCDKEEIKDTCGLTESEADLIITLHKKSQGQVHSTVLAN